MTRIPIPALALFAACIAGAATAAPPLERIKLPPGFEIEVYADRSPGRPLAGAGRQGHRIRGHARNGRSTRW